MPVKIVAIPTSLMGPSPAIPDVNAIRESLIHSTVADDSKGLEVSLHLSGAINIRVLDHQCF